MYKENLEVKKNRKGFGVYATRPYKIGEKICIMRGKKVVPKNLEYHEKNFRKAIIDPLQIGTTTYLVLEKPYIFLNHSCDPNVGVKGVSTLFAIKNIHKGDEITFDYSTTIDESFLCKCGSQNCRRVIVDFFGLPLSKQRAYARKGALQNFIKRKFEKIQSNL